jgi:hypothetical protein
MSPYFLRRRNFTNRNLQQTMTQAGVTGLAAKHNCEMLILLDITSEVKDKGQIELELVRMYATELHTDIRKKKPEYEKLRIHGSCYLIF